jgi:hypothetical protein
MENVYTHNSIECVKKLKEKLDKAKSESGE